MALVPSMPMQRWMQPPTFRQRKRVMSCFLCRSSVFWWMWVKRLIVWPVRWDVAVIRSAFSGFSASSKVVPMMLRQSICSSLSRSIFSPSK